ncbi:MAG: MaoC family dehydratase [Desulfomonilaceae bacterium]
MTFTTPQEDRYFEDYLPGAVHEFGSITIEQDEIIEFARRFDPQSFHIDPEKAKQTAFGGLIASGWHTASLAMRLLVDNYVSKVASLGSPGVDEVRWRKPVRPGDTLSIRVTVIEAKLSRSKPGQGTTRSLVEVLNQHGEVVMTWKGMGLVRCRKRTDIGSGKHSASVSMKKGPGID